MSVFGIKATTLNLVGDWKRARQTEVTARNNTNSQCRTWCRPQEGWIKINLDASFYEGNDTIGIGCWSETTESAFFVQGQRFCKEQHR